MDIRCSVSCTIDGQSVDLISGNVSDDYLPGNGLIKTQGDLTISGLFVPAVGALVSINYTMNGYSSKIIPKKLYVIGASNNPFEGTSNITFGDTLTLNSELREPINWSQYDDPLNNEADPLDALIVTYPIYWSSIANFCAQKLGVTLVYAGIGFDASHRFSVKEFSYEPGYVQILSDLLQSIGAYGYMNESNAIIVKPIEPSDDSYTNVIDGSSIISLTDNNQGDIPGTSVTVSYNTLKLKDPESLDEESGLGIGAYCDTSSSRGVPEETVLESKDRNGQTKNISWNYAPWSESKTCYDVYGRNRYDETINYDIMAKSLTGVYANLLSGCNGEDERNVFSHGTGSAITTRKTETFYYVNGTGSLNIADIKKFKELKDFDKVKTTITTLLEPQGVAISGVSTRTSTTAGLNPFNLSSAYSQGQIVTEKQVTNYYYSTKTVQINGKKYERETVRTTTDKWAIAAKTQEGQRLAQEQSKMGYNAEAILGAASRLVYLGQEQTFSDTLDTDAIKDNDPLAKNAAGDADPNNGYTTPSVAQMTLVTGTSSSNRIKTYNMPYAPDDRFIKTGNNPATFASEKSNASNQAFNYGRIQHRLDQGRREGITIQTHPWLVPTRSGTQVALNESGYIGRYLVNGTVFSFNSDGLVVSVELIYWNPVGGTGASQWLRVSPNTVLPPAPTVTNYSPNVIGTISNAYA